MQSDQAIVEAVTEDATPVQGRPKMTPKDLALAKMQGEYAQLCAAAGEAAYQRAIYDARVKDLTTRMRKLNVKASKLAGKEAAAETVAAVD